MEALARTAGILVEQIQKDLRDNRCHLIQCRELLPQIGALAGTAHSARILGRLAEPVNR